MESENKNLIEGFMSKLITNKKKLIVFICGILSVLCSFFYISQANLSSIMLVYMMCLLVSASMNVVSAIDVEDKYKYTNNTIVLGSVIFLFGLILRIIRLGILFSLQYFIAYFFFGLTMCFVMIKLARNQGKHRLILVLLILISAYDILEFICKQSIYFTGIFWKIYHIAEAGVFIQYLFIIQEHKKDENKFGLKLSRYCNQVPTRNICITILIFISVISIVIGGLIELNDNSNKKEPTVTTKVKIEEPEEKESVSNKAKGTVKKNNSTEVEANEVKETPVAMSQKKTEEITLGQVIVTDRCEFTLNKVEFSHDVIPDTPPRYYTHYPSSSGQVYIYVNASVKNTQKSELPCDEIYSVTADYDSGYSYTGMNIANDEDGDFTYANITNVAPLQTLGVHCLIDCPEEVETSGKPLFLTIKFKDGTEYKYIMR